MFSRPSDPSRRRARTITLILATALVIAPAAAFAGHQFNDVPNSNIFHDDIDWMRDNGVTRGCNPPTNDEYCPDDTVTREQMAAFLRRLDTQDVFLRPGDVEGDGVDGGDAETLDGLDSDAFARSANLQPYFVTIDGANDVTLGTSGPLTLIGRCDPGNEVQVLVTSSVDGWFQTDNENTAFSAGDEEEVLASSNTGAADDEVDVGSAISANAAGDMLHYIGYDGESTLLGLDILGHDCIIGGTIQANSVDS